MTPDDLQPGATLHAYGDDGLIIPIKLASLFKIHGDQQLYALAGSSDKALKNCKKVSVGGTRDAHDAVGSLSAHNPLAAKGGMLSELFSVIEVDDKVAHRFNLAEARTSKLKTQDVLSLRPVRLRKIVETAQAPVRFHNRRRNLRYLRGYVAGQVTNPKIISLSSNKPVVLKRAMVAARSSIMGRRAFAEAGDAGTPVLSNSRRLLGFIVGQKGDETLVLPAEDLAKACDLTFFSPDMPTGRPRVKIVKPQP